MLTQGNHMISRTASIIIGYTEARSIIGRFVIMPTRQGGTRAAYRRVAAPVPLPPGSIPLLATFQATRVAHENLNIVFNGRMPGLHLTISKLFLSVRFCTTRTHTVALAARSLVLGSIEQLVSNPNEMPRIPNGTFP